MQRFPRVEGDSLLYNVYHVLELNPQNASRITVVGGTALADFLVAPETQRLIGEYGKSRFGQSLLVPDAGQEPSRHETTPVSLCGLRRRPPSRLRARTPHL